MYSNAQCVLTEVSCSGDHSFVCRHIDNSLGYRHASYAFYQVIIIEGLK